MVGADVMWAVSLRIVHALQWLRETVQLMMVWIWEAVFYAALKHKGSKLECIQNDVKELRKIPMHIAVIVQEEELSYNDLANILVWSFSAGVHTVSLYDPRGKSESRLVFADSSFYFLQVKDQQHQTGTREHCTSWAQPLLPLLLNCLPWVPAPPPSHSISYPGSQPLPPHSISYPGSQPLPLSLNFLPRVPAPPPSLNFLPRVPPPPPSHSISCPGTQPLLPCLLNFLPWGPAPPPLLTQFLILLFMVQKPTIVHLKILLIALKSGELTSWTARVCYTANICAQIVKIPFMY